MCHWITGNWMLNMRIFDIKVACGIAVLAYFDAVKKVEDTLFLEKWFYICTKV